MTKKLSILGAAVAAALALGAVGNAAAHGVSIGYTNAGAGAVTVWLGTYSHGTPTNEGSMNLTGVNGNPFASTTLAFNILTAAGVGFKPAGLVDGVTNFFVDGLTNGPLVNSEASFNAACPACGPVQHWQGVTFSGLSAGDYQFTWVPQVNPTAEWTPLSNMDGIFTLSGAVVNGTPEPGSLALVGLAMFGLAAAQRRRAA